MKTIPTALRLTSILVLLLAGLGSFPTPVSALTRAIYTDQLLPGWDDWSWSTTLNPSASLSGQDGTHCLAVTYTGGWAGLYLHKAVVDTSGATQLSFLANKGSTAGSLEISLFLTLEVNGQDQHGPEIIFTLPNDSAWKKFQFPLSTLNPTNAPVVAITLQSRSNSPQPTFYLDDIAWDNLADPAAPQLSAGSLFPHSVPADGRSGVVVRVAVSDPQGAGDVASVSLDASPFGRGTISLRDDGRSNDGQAGDGVYGAVFTIAPETPTGEQFLVVPAHDKAGHADSFPLGALEVLDHAGGSIPAALPQRFGWGSNAWDPDNSKDWQVTSGVPWNYVYQYITYDWYVNGWGGNFVGKFVAHAWTNHYVPVVTVYNILGTPPTCGEGGICYAGKLKNASAVSAYLATILEAAKEAKGSQPVIFVIEPDFYGSMQQLSNDANNRPAGVRQDDPTSYPVALNVSGYANNLAGFGKRIVDLIHATAPNALVAPMASMWATHMDPASVTGAETIQFGQRTAAFIDAMGGDKSDLLVVEWSDRDGGSGLRPWWDDSDQELPRPSRAVLWENALSHAAQKRLMLWQIPAGNMQLDNTCDHYQDNRAAYAFSHPRDLFDAGVLGLVFGGGMDCMTNVTTDGGFIAAQGAIAYARPAAPAGLSADPLSGLILTLRWNESSEPDRWKYRVYTQLQPSGSIAFFDTDRKNSAQVLLPKAGTWKLWVTAVDAMGNESAPSSTLAIASVQNAQQLFLPLVRR